MAQRIYKLVRETKTKVLNISTSLILISMSLGGALPVAFLRNAAALGTVVSPSNTLGWGAQDGTPTFAAGPTGADGYGSLKLTTDTQPKQNYFHATNTPLSGIDGLGYKVDVTAGVPASYQLQVLGATKADNSGTTFTSLVWEPVYNGQTNGPNGGFVTESNLENGIWWSSRAIAGAPTQSTYVHLSDIIAANAGAIIVAYGVNVGSGTPNATSYVDDVSFQSQVTNFETDPPAAPTGLYFTRTGSTTPIVCGSTVNAYAGMTLHWTAPSGDLYQYAITPSYPDNHGQYTYYPNGSATSVWIGDNFGHHGNGVYTYVMKAQNTAKQWSDPVTCTLAYDTQSPTASFTTTPPRYANGNFWVYGTAADNVGLNDAFFDVRDASGWVAGCVPGTFSSTPSPIKGSASVNLQCQINTSNLVDGQTYTLRVHASDLAGYGGGQSAQLTIDRTAPSVPSLLSPVDRGYTKTNDFYFDWTDSNDANPGVTYEFQSSLNSHTTNGVLDTNVWDSLANGQTLPTSQIHSTGAPDGTWYWQVRAIDAAGNKSAWTSVWHVTLDTNGPSGSISYPTINGYVSTRQTGNILTVTGTAADNLGLNRVLVQLLTSSHGALQNKTVYLSGTSTNWQAAFNTSDLHLADGKYAVVASFDDNAGNVYKTSYIDFTLDNTKPQAKFTNTTSLPTPNGSYNGDITVGYTVTDNFKLKSVNVSLRDAHDTTGNQWRANCYNNQAEATDSDTGTCTIHLPAGLPDGEYYVQIGGQDAAGNWTVNATRTVIVDRTAPVVSITAPHDGDTVRGTVTVSGTVTDVNPGHYYFVVKDSGGHVVAGPRTVNAAAVADWQWDTTQVSDGTYTIDLEARDAAGNKNSHSVQTILVTVDNTAPVVTDDFNISFLTNQSRTLQPTVTDASSPLTYLWSVSDQKLLQGNPSQPLNGTSLQIGSAPKGDYTVTLTVTDPAGNATTKIYAVTISTPATPGLTTQALVGGRGGGNTAGPTQVLGAETTTPSTVTSTDTNTDGTDTTAGQVKGDNVVKTENAASTNTKSSNFFGLGWWWLLILAAIAGLVWFLAGRRSEQD